jgi:acyl carrier protein
MEIDMSTITDDTPMVRPDIAEIIADVFQYDGPVKPTTSPDDIARWDSLQHIALVRALESSFDIQLSMDEMVEMQSIAAIETVLTRHGV